MPTQNRLLHPTTLTGQATALLALLVKSISSQGDVGHFRSIPLQKAIFTVGTELMLTSTLDILLNTRTKLSISVEGTPAPILRTAWKDHDDLIYGIDETLVSHFRTHGKLVCELFQYDFSACAQ